MWWKNKYGIGLLALFLVAFLGWQLYFYGTQQAFVRQAQHCIDTEVHGAEQIACLYRAMEAAVDARGLEAGFAVFAYAYEHSAPFVQTGCHRHAHKMGDIAYYNIFLVNPDITAMEFPQETTACGYGFFHGFVEHYIQDRPTSAEVTELCTYLGDRYGEAMGDIQLTCYHGAGHGFMLAEIERQPQSNWGNVAVFAQRPVALCNALPDAKDYEREECRQGIFNVIVEWGEEKNYGFSYERGASLAVCRGLPDAWMHACLYEAAQKYDGVVRENPRGAWEAAQRVSPEHALMIIAVAAAGVVQQTIHDHTYEAFARECLDLPDEVGSVCIEAVVHGLFEHGEPTQEYQQALSFCAESMFSADESAQERCARALVGRLSRFYTQERIEKEVCPAIVEVLPATRCSA